MPLPKRSSQAIYLGDGVYADVEIGMVRLTTENGIDATNTIYLEMGVMCAFLHWWQQLSTEIV